MRKWFEKSFINDEDGFSGKDFLMVSFVALYIAEHFTVFILSLFHLLPEYTANIVESLNPLIVTIIGGVFTVNVSRTVMDMMQNRKAQQSSYRYDDYDYETDPLKEDPYRNDRPLI